MTERIAATFIILSSLILFLVSMNTTGRGLAHALAPSSARRINVRVELFFSSDDELRRRIGFLRSKGITRFNLVNKSNGDDTLKSARVIESEFSKGSRSDVSVCAHYSMKYNKSRKLDGAFSKLKEFTERMNELNVESELLLVTGSGPKGNLDSLAALQRLQKESVDVCVGIAFNPFFPDEVECEGEKARLLQKLETGLVNKVYLQFGTNLERLRGALQLLTELQSTHSLCFDICGSIFLPTKKLLAQQRFRPWNGVFLSDEFLSSEDSARGVVLQMMRLYEQFGCEIIIEAPGVRSEKDWSVVESLLMERDKLTTSFLNDERNNDEKAAGSDCGLLDETDNARPKRRKTNPTLKPKNNDASVRNIPPTTIPSNVLGKSAIVLFHSHDVRLHDNVAFQMASYHERVIPVFLWSKAEQGRWGVTGCLEVVLKDALRYLKQKLRRHDLDLVFREGNDSSTMLQRICKECDAGAVYWNKEHTTESRLREARYRASLREMDVEFIESQSSLLYDPVSLSLSTGFRGGHWGTLMPFLKGCKKQLGEPRIPMRRADTFHMLERIRGPDAWPPSTAIDELDMAVICGKDKWDASILERFCMSEEDALANMDKFFQGGFPKYERERSRADIEGSTSKLSAHLRIGTLSPNELYYKIQDSSYSDSKTFPRRLLWRDLAYFHLHSFPEMRDKSIRLHYENIEWCSKHEEKQRFNAWKLGRTGFPLVDAGMRELYTTGWMQQSIRMVVASFLVEYLRVNWVNGCEWFHYTLVDADSAINPMMWQNAGRSGIDQWNFVLSPIAASQDATGEYTRKWVPELSKLPNSVLHKPWEAPAMVLQDAGVVLGETYPIRVVSDIKAERVRSVEAVLEMRRQNQQFNNDRGYDLIQLPDGKQTVVFTKKEFRIDKQGRVINETARDKSSKGSNNTGGRGRKGKAAQKKLLRQQAAAKS